MSLEAMVIGCKTYKMCVVVYTHVSLIASVKRIWSCCCTCQLVHYFACQDEHVKTYWWNGTEIYGWVGGWSLMMNRNRVWILGTTKASALVWVIIGNIKGICCWKNVSDLCFVILDLLGSNGRDLCYPSVFLYLQWSYAMCSSNWSSFVCTIFFVCSIGVLSQ